MEKCIVMVVLSLLIISSCSGISPTYEPALITSEDDFLNTIELPPSATSIEQKDNSEEVETLVLFYVDPLESCTYDFELKSDNTLTVNVVQRKSYIPKETKPSYAETIILSKKDINEISNILNGITVIEPVGILMGKRPEIHLIYISGLGHMHGAFLYGHAKNEYINQLIGKLISLSPIKVVYDDGTEIKPYSEGEK